MTHFIDCTHCERTDKAIFNCPSRELGRCPFIKYENVKKFLGSYSPRSINKDIIICLLIYVCWGLISYALINAYQNLIDPFFIFLLLLLPCFLILAIVIAISKTIRLHNHLSGMRLEFSTLAGRITDFKWSTSGEIFPIHIQPSQNFSFPLSITAFSVISPDVSERFRSNSTISDGNFSVSEKQCVIILRFALINLIFTDHIEAYSYANSSSENNYYFVVGRNSDPVKGVLESEIFKQISLWVNRSTTDMMEIWSWSEGPTIYDLVFSVFSDRKDLFYSEWLIENVYRNFLELGLGQIMTPPSLGITTHSQWLKLDKLQISKIRQEIQIADNLSEQVTLMYPDFSQEMNTKILLAIQNRQPKSDD